jgi:putative transcription antitermination factor YqgF
MNQKTQAFLGIDYGSQRVGLSIANTPIAEPYKIVPRDKFMDTIKNICQQENVTDIVVGISENKTAVLTLEFIDKLKKVIDLPIHTQDETLSSHQVKEHFIDTGMKKSKLHGAIDHYSATIILQEYLDDHHPFEI